MTRSYNKGLDLMWRPVFLYLSHSNSVRQLSTRLGVARRAIRRFVAGETLSDAIEVTKDLNRVGAGAEIDYLGENVTERGQAVASAEVYLTMLDEVAGEHVDAQVSLKLTQMGLDVDPALCRENLERVVVRAAEQGNFVWVDMESSEYTDRTLEVYRELRSRHDNVGVAIQAYLHRSKDDVLQLLAIGGTVRLCKGAYLEPAQLAFPDKRDVDRNFNTLSELLLSSRRLHAIATHDEALIDHVVRFAEETGVAPGDFEFQMLYGVRRDLQQRLTREGYRLRVYVPYGSEWYPYFMRRLAERPANLLFVLSSVAREKGSRAVA